MVERDRMTFSDARNIRFARAEVCLASDFPIGDCNYIATFNVDLTGTGFIIREQVHFVVSANM